MLESELARDDSPSSVRPKLAKGCKLHNKENAILIPEGILKLNSQARQVLDLCNGERSIAAIVASLQNGYLPVLHARIREETMHLLERLHHKRVVDFL